MGINDRPWHSFFPGISFIKWFHHGVYREQFQNKDLQVKKYISDMCCPQNRHRPQWPLASAVSNLSQSLTSQSLFPPLQIGGAAGKCNNGNHGWRASVCQAYTSLSHSLALSNHSCLVRPEPSVITGSLWIKMILKGPCENIKMQPLERGRLKIPNNAVP